MVTPSALAADLPEPATLLIAHEHTLFRAAVRAGLECDVSLRVAGEAASGGRAIAEVSRIRPDVVVIDADLPPEGGVRTCTAVKELDIPTRVMMMCRGDDHRLLLGALE